MQHQYNAIIADTSCFILLDKINYLHILREVFVKVTTIRVITNEFGKELPAWVLIENVNDLQHQNSLQSQIDIGEASAIALAIEKKIVCWYLMILKREKSRIDFNYNTQVL